MRSRWIIVAVMDIVGLIWIGQGLGILGGGSFMVGDPLWAVLGGVLLVLCGFIAGATVRAGRH